MKTWFLIKYLLLEEIQKSKILSYQFIYVDGKADNSHREPWLTASLGHTE